MPGLALSPRDAAMDFVSRAETAGKRGGDRAAAHLPRGVGSAVMMPVSRVRVIRSVGKSELMNALNWLLLPSIIGPMMGPVLGGQLVTYGNWHWIFLINIPVALIGVIMTMFVVPDIRDH